jgi:hypothetical protein
MVGFLAVEEIWIRNLSIMAGKPLFSYPHFSSLPRFNPIQRRIVGYTPKGAGRVYLVKHWSLR